MPEKSCSLNFLWGCANDWELLAPFLGDVQYLLLDEPTNGLDPMGIKEIRLLLKERLKSPQHCILVSSHNLTEIAAVTDVLIFIRDGKSSRL